MEKESSLGKIGIASVVFGIMASSLTQNNTWHGITILGSAVIVSTVSKWLKTKDVFYDVFRELKLFTEKERAHVISKWDYPWGKKYLLNLPMGMSVKDFEKKKDEISQHFGNHVTFSYVDAGKMTVELIETKLKTLYPFALQSFNNAMEIPIGYGRKEFISCSFTEKNPNLVVVGMTGSGKSVFFRQVIVTIILTRLVTEILLDLIDLKTGITFKLFKNCVHVDGYADDLPGAIAITNKLERVMKKREEKMAEYNIDNITDYNKRFPEKRMPYRLVVVDEFITLLDERSPISSSFARIVRQGRSSGIFFIFGTQKATSESFPRSIRSNLGNKLCFRVHDEYDSRSALGQSFGELASKIEVKGRAIYQDVENHEVQVMFLSPETAKQLISPFVSPEKQVDSSMLLGVRKVDNC